MHKEQLTLATICGGAVQEKVDRALKKIADNILDPNTDAGKKRSITLKVTMKPDEDDREDVAVSAEVSYSLAPETGVQTQFFVNKDLTNGRVTVMEHKKGEIKGQLDFSDMEMFGEEEGQEPAEEEFDTETGEIFTDTAVGEVIDFRRQK